MAKTREPPERSWAHAQPGSRWVRLRRASVRWFRVLTLALLGAVTFELILPFVWNHSEARLPYSPAFLELVVWLGVLILFFLVSEPVRIRRRQWRSSIWYPPAWSAVPFALVLAAASELLPIGIRPQTAGPDWKHTFPLTHVAAALAIAVLLRQLPWRRHVRHETLSEAPQDSVTWQDIKQWISAGERPVASGEPDLFRHRPLAMRIAQIVGREGRPVALLGRFGTGKSSILNVVRAELDRLEPRVIVAGFDVWAAPKPEDIPRLALSRIVAALDDFVDTTEFRRLPLSYQRLAAAEPTGRLGNALGLDDAADSLEELERLSPILDVLNARVVLIVEDVERAGQQFDTRHLERFLWALRRVERSSFVLAVDPDSAPLDFAKLCDTIERVPAIDVEQVARILTVAYGHWMSAFSYIDPHPRRRDGDKLRLAMAHMGDFADYMRRTGRDTPLDALVSLLETPRSLKHVLRRVERAWASLHGEAELDDIVIVSALRHGAPDVYGFLLADIDPARHEPDDLLPRTKTVKADWDRLIGGLPNGPAAQRLVDLIGIKQLSGEGGTTTPSPQGVHESDPVDYFSRVVAEELSSDELRDQRVLQDIDQWKVNQAGALVDRLVAASDADNQYARVWEHFAARHTDADLLELTSEVVARLLARDRASAAGDHPAVLALWRGCRRLPRNQHADWFRALIVSAVPVSLHFVNGLFYYWTGAYGIVDGAARAGVRQSISDAIRATIRNADDLVHVLARDHPYEVGGFITANGSQPTSAALGEWRDHFAQLLIDGARLYPEAILPEVANLVGDEQSGMRAAGVEPPVFINRYKIDRAHFEVLFGDRLDEPLALLADYAGTSTYVIRAKDDAKAWREERYPTGPKV